MSYELDAIAAAVIGGSSLMGGVGRITGTLIGAVILGLIKSGFTFIGVDSYIQDIIKGVIIVAAVSIDMRRNRKNTDCRELPPARGWPAAFLPGTHHELPERAVAGGGAVRVCPGMGANHRRVDGLFRPELLTIIRRDRQGAKARGITVQFEDARGDVGRQTDQVQSFISAGVDAIIVDPVNSASTPVMTKMVVPPACRWCT